MKSPCGEDSLAGYVPKMIGSVVGIYNGKVCRLVVQSCNCLRLVIGVQLCGDQARDDGPLLGRVQYLIQACQAQSCQARCLASYAGNVPREYCERSQ